MDARRMVVAEPDADDEVVAFNDLDTEEELSEIGAAPRQLVDLLRRALPAQVRDDPPSELLAQAAARLRGGLSTDARPHRYIRRAAGFGDALPAADDDLLLTAMASFVSPPEGVGLAPADQAAIRRLQPADWVGAILGLARAGPGAPAGPHDVLRAIDECPEVEGKVPPEQREAIVAAFEVILPVWEAAGALAEGWTLTAIGVWLLPRALARAWGEDLFARPATMAD